MNFQACGPLDMPPNILPSFLVADRTPDVKICAEPVPSFLQMEHWVGVPVSRCRVLQVHDLLMRRTELARATMIGVTRCHVS